MKKQVVILASLLAASHGAAFASNADHAAVQFSSAEAQQLFEQGEQPMQVAELSQKEMKATEGAWIANAIGGGLGALGYLGTYWGDYAISHNASWNWGAFGGSVLAGAANPVRGAAAFSSGLMYGVVGPTYLNGIYNQYRTGRW